MNTDVVIRLLLVAAALIVGITGALFYRDKADCYAAYDRMDALIFCIDTPGCLYKAEDVYKGMRAATQFQNNDCVIEVKRPQLKKLKQK